MVNVNPRWGYQKIGDVMLVERGGSPRPISKYLTDSDDGLNWIKISDATASDKYIYKTKQKILKEGLHKTRLVHEGDFLLSNSMSFGRPYIMKTTGCIHDGWLVLKEKVDGLLDKEFLYHLLGSPYIFEQFDKLAAGSTVRNLNIGLVSSVSIPIPPLEEQKQIVAVLDQAFAAIDQAKANIEKNLQNAKELFQSKLNEIFTHPSTSSGDKQGGALSLSKGEGWEEKKLGDSSLLSIIDGDRGKNYPKKSDFLPEGHCVFMNTGNVRPNGFDFSTVMFITEKRDNLLRKGKLQRNDVVMTTRGTIGNLGWFNDAVKYENIRINSGMLIFRVNQKKILPDYLFTVLRSPVVTKQIEEMTSGAAQPQLPIKTLVHFDIPFHPDLVKQRNMIGKIQELESMTDSLVQTGAKKLRNLDELKKSILQKAFAGELI